MSEQRTSLGPNGGAPCGPENSLAGSISSGERMPANWAASTQIATRSRVADPIRKQSPMAPTGIWTPRITASTRGEVRENYALVENSAESARTVLLAAAIVGLIAFG